jgi:hypothetical protein
MTRSGCEPDRLDRPSQRHGLRKNPPFKMGTEAALHDDVYVSDQQFFELLLKTDVIEQRAAFLQFNQKIDIAGLGCPAAWGGTKDADIVSAVFCRDAKNHKTILPE